MYSTRSKIPAVVLLVTGIGGVFAAGTKKADEASTISRNMALSRLNLRKLAVAMQYHADATKGFLPPSALINKDGKAVLSWRVLLLPYLGERELYEQFKLSEPWDGPHNKKLLSKMPKVFAPPGIKTPQPFSTFYQVFVSPKPKEEGSQIQAAFVQGKPQRFPAHFPDGLSHTILIVEAGKAVPWTKPEDLPYDADKPLPELGGLFPDVFQTAFASSDVHVLTKNYNEYQLRLLITSNEGLPVNLDQVAARSAAGELRSKNRELHQDLDDARERLRLLQEERDALQQRASGAKTLPDADSRLDELKKENSRLQNELEKIDKESRSLKEEIRQRLQKPSETKTP